MSSGPDFDAAVARHRLLDMIMRASETGMKQIASAVWSLARSGRS